MGQLLESYDHRIPVYSDPKRQRESRVGVLVRSVPDNSSERDTPASGVGYLDPNVGFTGYRGLDPEAWDRHRERYVVCKDSDFIDFDARGKLYPELYHRGAYQYLREPCLYVELSEGLYDLFSQRHGFFFIHLALVRFLVPEYLKGRREYAFFRSLE